MATMDSRERWIALVLLALLGIATLILAGVLTTVFFAITLGYVLYPARRALVERGVSRRNASVGLTLLVIASVLLLLVPPLVVVYQRRAILVHFLQNLPDTIVLGVEGFAFIVESDVLVASVQRELTNLGIRLARDAAILAMKLFLFVFVMYALMLRPFAIRSLSLDVVPESYQDVVEAFHHRSRRTLYGIYVVQVATGVLTFLVALPVFFLLGYEAFFSLSVVSGILQFLPIVGPSIVVVGVGLYDFAVGNSVRALIVLPVGLVAIGFAPDVVLRPRLAHRTAGMAASLYFVGFTGGVLSLGPAGIIAGPLVIALVLEAIELFAIEVGGREREGGAR